MLKGFFSERKFSTAFTILVLILGGTFYFTVGEGSVRVDPSIFQDMKLKTAYTPEGQLKLFALCGNNHLAKLRTTEGYPIPEKNTMVIGASEAAMMKEEGLFSTIGDSIDGLFGINTTVGGVLRKTNSVLDELHYLSASQFDQLESEENRAFIKLKDGTEPKLFYTYLGGENSPLKFNLSEGSLSDYATVHKIAGEKYYPIIIGSEEAEMMKREKLFSKPGDFIKGFFGVNVVIVGVIEKTNTSLDMAHLVPLAEGDLK